MNLNLSTKIVIVLIRPQLGENIGAVARVMKNFSITELRIVNPRDGWPNEKANSMSAGGIDLIKQALIFDNVSDAIKDCTKVLATTARIRDINKEMILPKDLKNEIDVSGKTAILFGPENSGLSNQEVSYANKIITIPVSEEYKSINISQAVGIVCYELYKIININYTNNQPLATSNDLEGLFKHLEDQLDKKGFFKVKEKKQIMINNLRGIFKRIKNLTPQDVNTLRGIIKSLSAHKDM